MKEIETIEVKITTPTQEIILDVSKIVKVKLSKKQKDFIYFDKMDDGTYRLCFTENAIKTKG